MMCINDQAIPDALSGKSMYNVQARQVAPRHPYGYEYVGVILERDRDRETAID